MEAIAPQERIKRRPRDKRCPTGKYVTVSKRPQVLAAFKALHEHGPLSTLYLFEYWKPFSASLGTMKNALTDLYHEDETEHGGPYLDKPGQDYSASTLNSFEIWDITRHAEHALEEAGYELLPRPFEGGLNPHRFMVSSVASSIELAALENRMLSYKPRSLIISLSPNKTLHIPAKISWQGRKS